MRPLWRGSRARATPRNVLAFVLGCLVGSMVMFLWAAWCVAQEADRAWRTTICPQCRQGSDHDVPGRARSGTGKEDRATARLT
jgi:hypothetical protein